MSAALDLSLAKKNLQDVIGDDMKIYLQLLRSWFKQKITREDFDHEARQLVEVEYVHLHNQFLLAILSKCQTLGSTIVSKESSNLSQSTSQSSPTKPSKKPKGRKRSLVSSSAQKNSFQQRFVPVNPFSQAPPVNLAAPEADEKGLSFASRDMLLPDIGMVHGRMIVTAWDYGLDKVEDNAVRLLMKAVENQLKNIITSMLSRRRSYKVREGTFVHSMGCEIPSSHLRQSGYRHLEHHSDVTCISSKGSHVPSMKPSIETATKRGALEMACVGDVPLIRHRITLFDLYEALKSYKSCIPSHTVYATNMERIVNRLWHPSTEEIEQEEIHKEEVAIKEQLLAEQHLMAVRS